MVRKRFTDFYRFGFSSLKSDPNSSTDTVAVNMDRYGERVKADVLMGADGLARAIRFVQ